jgi:hypothetical protein
MGQRLAKGSIPSHVGHSWQPRAGGDEAPLHDPPLEGKLSDQVKQVNTKAN